LPKTNNKGSNRLIKHDHSSDESKKDLSNADVAETQEDDGNDETRDNN